jgi:hypothetical protein
MALATAINESAKAHEASFDRNKYETAVAAENLSIDGISFVDPADYFTLNLHEACVKHAGELADPVYLLLANSWNDALEWAGSVFTDSKNNGSN